jgi:hypothetical protein
MMGNFSFAYAGAAKIKQSSGANSAQKKWLFVITAKDAKVSKNAKGELVLNLFQSNIQNILKFSQTQNVVFEKLSSEQMVSIWHKDVGKFMKRMPTAVACFGKDVFFITLNSIKIDGTHISFSIKSKREINPMDVNNFSMYMSYDINH